MTRATHRLLSLWLLMLPVAAAGQVVLFSHEGGFYADTFGLAMQVGFAPEGGNLSIHYTFDGNEPSASDPVYSTPLSLTKRCYSQAGIYRVQTVPDDRWFVPDSVERIVVVRAAAFDSAGTRRSAVTTSAYLIDSLLGRRIALPVVSICTDSLSLFDRDTGIYIRGAHHDERFPYGTGNYFQKGRQWERRAAFGYYDSGGVALEQDCGLRMHGNSQRVLAQKGLSLYARREYGPNGFDYPFFANRQQWRYRRLVLRPWKTSWSASGVEDWMCQQLADPLRCDNMATRPVVLFLNGEYWGIYFLEEKADEHYVEEHHGVPDEEVDLLAYWGDEVEHGSNERWKALYRWLEKADMRREDDYAYLQSQVDVEALMDYMLLQLLVLNDDWPVNNVRFWSAEGERWRWLFFDGDEALSSFPRSAGVLDHMTYNQLRPSTHSSPQATLLFRRLYARPEFLQRSMQRLEELVDSYFAYSYTGPLLQQMVAQLEAEVPYQIRRFASPTSMAAWHIAISTIDDFLRIEPEATVNEYAVYFGLPSPRGEELAIDGDGMLHVGIVPTAKRSVDIYDINGRTVGEMEMKEGRAEMTLPSLPAGVYFVQMRDSGQALRWIVRN